MIPFITMLFPSILDAANKENRVGVVYTHSEMWLLYRLHCFRTQDHQRRTLPLQSIKDRNTVAGLGNIGKVLGLGSTRRNPKIIAAAVSANPEINVIA
jgi:hypothetical protein